MDLNDVALFINVVRAGSFAEAGRRLGMPPSTASRRVQALEAGLGARLLQRTTRRLVLTDAGRTFYAEAADQIDALDRVADRISSDASEVHGKVRVAAPVDFFDWFPADKLAGFMRSHPRLRLEFELDDARVDLLGAEIDVALRGGDRDPSVVARKVGTNSATLVASPGYLTARGAPAHPRDLKAHDCITAPVRGGTPVSWRLGGAKRMAAPIEVDGPFKANTASAQLAAAIAGLGIALLPATLTAPHVVAGRLSEVLPAYASDPMGVHLVYLSRRHLPRAVSAFIEFAAAAIDETGLIRPPRVGARRSA